MVKILKPIQWCETHKCKPIAVSLFDFVCPLSPTGVKEGDPIPKPCKIVYILKEMKER